MVANIVSVGVASIIAGTVMAEDKPPESVVYGFLDKSVKYVLNNGVYWQHQVLLV